MEMAHTMSPDEVALRRDLDSLAFRLGERRDKWRLLLLNFPHLYVQIVAPERAQGPGRFLLRVDAAGYRAIAPTAALWDGPANAPLAEPFRPLNAGGGLLIGFTSSCGICLYHPIDRQARDHWPQNHGDLAWGPDSDIITFLETVHALVHDKDYSFSCATDAQAGLQGGPLEAGAQRVA